MITLRRSEERGHFQHGWLDTYHSFSFAHFHDPEYMGFRMLRVLNDDTVAPGGGFGTHPHDNMEIVSYVLAGALEHRDSMGSGSVLRPGDVQCMSAGTGITHSEFNHSKTDPLHFLQIWIVPERQGLSPRYDEKQFSADEKRGRLRLIVSPDGDDGSLPIHQDVSIYATLLGEGHSVEHALLEGRAAWVQVAHGTLALNGISLRTGDGAAVTAEDTLTLVGASAGTEVLLFDLG